MRFWRLLLLALLLIVPASAWAIDPDEIMSNPTLEARARTIGGELRCLVCQNESIDESQAPLAKDLRRIVRQRLLAGDSDDQVKAFLVGRYGDFILLKPPFDGKTLLLWLAPLLCLAGGGGAAFWAARGARQRAAAMEFEGPLNEGERLRLAGLLTADEPGEAKAP